MPIIRGMVAPMRAVAFLVLLLLAAPAWAGCPVLDETGEPQLQGAARIELVCHTGYAAAVDDDALVPRWVAYRLTATHTLGCNGRANNFHAEDQLAGRRATPADYAGSGYDRGHQMPAEDGAWDEAAESDTFSMANMAPQVQGLNRAMWERLEETARAWAWGRGALVVFVGPVIGAAAPRIGTDGVVVPDAFWKVLYDPAASQALAFIMPQQPVAKGPLEPWEVSIAEVEQRAGVSLPLPATVDRTAVPALWPADLRGWHRAHKAACAATG